MDPAGGDGSVLLKYITAVLKKWTGLQLAIEQGMGGRYAREKEVWFGQEIEKFLLNNDGLEYYEVEDFVSDILDEEFSTICEDGSLAEVAQKFFNASHLYKAGSLDELVELIPRDISSHVGSSVAVVDLEEEKEAVGLELEMAPLSSNFQNLRVQDSRHSESTDTSTQKDPLDEWTVVSRGRRKK